MSGALQAVFQNQRGFVVTGQQAYTSAGTYSWVAPTGVTSVSVVAVGGGSTGVSEGAGGAGGALGYKNNISVTPGSSYTVVVGSTGVTTEYYANGSSISGFNGTGEYRIYVNTSLGNTYYNAGTSSGSVSGIDNFSGIQALILTNTGRLVKTGPQKSNTGTVQFYSILTSSGDSYFSTRGTVGGGGAYSLYGYGGVYSGDGGGNGGNCYGGAAGGAGGYSGNGGNGIAAGNGGGGGGGSYSGLTGQGAGGGGVGILGQGSNGTAGTPSNSTTYNQTMNGGGGGSGGAAGGNTTNTDSGYSARNGGNGGAYGGGGGSSWNGTNGVGAAGAVRIIWPGTTRSFPSTNTGDL